jgi:VIT1/CCC1 family predicted Fe2+/Mn2+ transporter
VAFLSVLIALVLTGTVSAMLGGARKRRAVLRVVLGGALAMLVTYGIGQMVGTTI